MSERESDKGSIYKGKLRTKVKITKETKQKARSDKDKSYETDEPVGGVTTQRNVDRAYDSDVLPIQNQGYVPPPLLLGAEGGEPTQSAGEMDRDETPRPQLTEEEFARLQATGAFDADGGAERRKTQEEAKKQKMEAHSSHNTLIKLQCRERHLAQPVYRRITRSKIIH